MIGIVLAAGAGSRLRPDTDAVPKAMLPVLGQLTILDLILGNLAAVGVERVALVVGHRADVIERRVPEWTTAHGMEVTTVTNTLALERNNCYSLWLAREFLADPALLVNGDTVHPVDVERGLLARHRAGDSNQRSAVTLAIDDRKALAEEEMKVVVDHDGHLARITKAMPPDRADGEYMGVSLIRGVDSQRLIDSLEQTWKRDSSLYYEDGFQAHVDAGGVIDVHPIGSAEWVEVDTHSDWETAKAIACRY